MAGISPISRARARPTQDRRETTIWLVMRISGLALFVLALAHFSILHFIFDPSEQDAQFIIEQRWSQLLWRALDWTMLMLVLFHSFLGMRTVVVDAISRERARRTLLMALYLLALVLFALGTWVVVTLPGLRDAAG